MEGGKKQDQSELVGCEIRNEAAPEATNKRDAVADVLVEAVVAVSISLFAVSLGCALVRGCQGFFTSRSMRHVHAARIGLLLDMR